MRLVLLLCRCVSREKRQRQRGRWALRTQLFIHVATPYGFIHAALLDVAVHRIWVHTRNRIKTYLLVY